MTERFDFRLGWRSLMALAGRNGRSASFFKDRAHRLGRAMHDHHITSKRRVLYFLATVMHESGGLVYMEEIANGAAYEGRVDLGNTHPGDGRRFKGRGPIQLTGRKNYELMSHLLGHDFIAHPEDLAKPEWAFKAAAAWWEHVGLNEIADTGNFIAVTRKVNGGTNGMPSRLAYLAKATPMVKFLTPQRRQP